MHIRAMNSQTVRSQRILACLGDASRFRVMAELVRGTCYVTDLAHRVGLSQSCTTRHLQHLEREGLVQSSRSGRRVFFSPSADPRVLELLQWALANESLPGNPLAASHSAGYPSSGARGSGARSTVAESRPRVSRKSPQLPAGSETEESEATPAPVPISELEDFLL
jgi:DNA-binding transcriptional ArsR family regulator